MSRAPSLFILNVPGLDLRRITPAAAPFTHELLQTYATRTMPGHPTTEIWPTLVTGVNPGRHHIWHCEIDFKDDDTFGGRLIDRLPDRLVCTAQMLRHFVDRSFDMPCIPRWRRRHLRFHRLKYDARQEPEEYRTVGGVPTLFDHLGDAAHYDMVKRFDRLPAHLERCPDPRYRLQWLEIHAYDLVEHYYLDRPDVMDPMTRELDDFIRAAHDRCRAGGTRFMLLVDHGQELVRGLVDIRRPLASTGVRREAYCYFQAVGVAKFWFREEAARRKITAALEAVPHLNLFTWRELDERFDLELGPRWGELYAITDNDHVFRRHDFQHLLADLYFGLTSREMRRRLTRRHHVAYHGLMPGHPAETGYFLVADPEVRPVADAEARLVDVAPTALSLVGCEPPPRMQGRVVLRADSGG